MFLLRSLIFLIKNNSNNTFSYLPILSWNYNYLQLWINELLSFISTNPQFDIIFIQKTHKITCSINISGYKLYHTPRAISNNWEGTTIYNKNHIPHKLMALTIRVLLLIYHMVSSTLQLYMLVITTESSQDISHVIRHHQHAFIAGGFNAQNRRLYYYRTTVKRNLTTQSNFMTST